MAFFSTTFDVEDALREWGMWGKGDFGERSGATTNGFRFLLSTNPDHLQSMNNF